MMFAPSLLVITAVFFSAFVRGVAGFGFALAAVPIISLVLPPVEAVAMGVLMQLAVGMRDAFVLFRDVHAPSLARLTVGSVVGTPLGLLTLTALDPDAARVLIAAAILLGLALILLRKPAEQRARNGLALVAGVASGTFSGLAAIPGPPAVAYYLGTGINAVQTRASLLVFFFIVSVMATPGLVLAGAMNGHILWLGLLSFPALAIGTWAGTSVFKRMDNVQYRRVAIAVMALSATLAGWRGLSAYV